MISHSKSARHFLAIGLLAATVFAQPAPKPKTFEVLALKPYGSEDELKHIHLENPRRVIISPVTAFSLLLRAYKVRSYAVVAPGWMKQNRYSLSANLPEGATEADTPAMLQQVLADRFHLKFHRESRDTTVYALTIHGALKLKRCEGDKCPPNANHVVQNVSISLSANTIEDMVSQLNTASDHTIIDRTNLDGHYSIDIEGVPPGGMVLDAKVTPPVSEVLKKLGLKLELRREKAEFLIVDEASPLPGEN